MRGVMEARAYARAYGVIKAPDADEESLERAGIGAEMSEAVVANIARAAGLNG